LTIEESGLIYKTTSEIKGPILMIENIKNVSYDEVVRIKRPTGEEITGSVLDVRRIGQDVADAGGWVKGIGKVGQHLKLAGSAIPWHGSVIHRDDEHTSVQAE
jgi:V/A-type H+-transporting ATPase subunit B